MSQPAGPRPIATAELSDNDPLRLSITGLYVSPGHNFFGHHGKLPGKYPLVGVDEVLCRAGRGIEGDRFFDHGRDYQGQITFFSLEVFDDLCRSLEVWDKHPGVLRRNAITTGDDLNRYIGRDLEIQGVRFRGVEECSPCHWMDGAFGPGCAAHLKGRGGLRARILTDGVLRVPRT
jgi:MOSC domain-containing protein YiiM